MFRTSVVISIFSFIFPVSLIAGDPTVIKQLAIDKKLHEDPYWHVLLHYRKTWGGFESEVDGELFFLSARGKTDPAEELSATVDGFFLPLTSIRREDIESHPRCAFPARYRFIRDSLSLTDADFPSIPCRNFEIYRSDFNARSVSYMFASYYMAAPASIYGHTFMKFNTDRADREELLDHAVNFAANPGDLDFFRYALYGLLGGYYGNYSLLPYHMKVREYNDMEDRDLWEYELNLTDRQIYLLQLHLWELAGRSSFRYYFATENCSYQLLTLIEAAAPEAELSSEYGGWVIPSETVKLLVNRGLVREVRYRPSARSALRQRMKQLTESERDYVMAVIESRLEPLLPPTEKNTYLYDTVLAALLYKKDQGDWTDEDRQYYRKLLLQRTQMPSFEDNRKYEPESTRVDQGHAPVMLRLGIGQDRDGLASRFVFRPIYQDFLAADTGYMPFSEIEVFSLRVRASQEAKPRIESARLMYLYSLSPADGISLAPSYMVDVGMRTVRARTVKRSPALTSDAALFMQSETIKEAVERDRHPELTLAHELLLGIREDTVYRPVAYADVLYGLSTGNVYSSSRFRYATGLLGGATVESGRSSYIIPRASAVFVGGTQTIRSHLQGNCYAGNVRNGCEIQMGFGFTPIKNHELRLEGIYGKETREYFASYSHYF